MKVITVWCMVWEKRLKLSSLTVSRKEKTENQRGRFVNCGWSSRIEDLNSSYSINQNVQILKSVNYMLSSPRCAIIKKKYCSKLFWPDAAHFQLEFSMNSVYPL